MRPVLLFDGDCGFCTSSVRWLRQWIPADVEIEPWQFADLDALGVPRHWPEREVVWVALDGSAVGGATAFARYLGVAGGAWPMVGAALRTPPVSWLAAGAYRLIANNRHRLPGGTPACSAK